MADGDDRVMECGVDGDACGDIAKMPAGKGD